MPWHAQALAQQRFLGLYCNWSLPDNANEIADRPVAQKYLAHFPKPVLDDLVNGCWLPVLGAGMSINATLAPPAKMRRGSRRPVRF